MKNKRELQTAIERMLRRAAESFGVEVMQLVEPGQGKRNESAARGVVCYLLRPILQTQKIGQILGNRAYTAIYSACDRVEQRMRRDHEFCVTVLALCDEFKKERKALAID